MALLDTDLLTRTAPLYERVKRVIPPFEWATFAEDVDAILEAHLQGGGRARHLVLTERDVPPPGA